MLIGSTTNDVGGNNVSKRRGAVNASAFSKNLRHPPLMTPACVLSCRMSEGLAWLLGF